MRTETSKSSMTMRYDVETKKTFYKKITTKQQQQTNRTHDNASGPLIFQNGDGVALGTGAGDFSFTDFQ